MKRLYVLVSHEPNQDPRIDWVSRFAAEHLQVTVFGMMNPARPESGSSSRHGYTIERLQRSWKGSLLCAGVACRCFWKSRLLWLSLPLVLLFALFFALPLLLFRCAFWTRMLLPRALRQRLREPVLWALRFLPSWFVHDVPRTLYLFRHFMTTAATHYRVLRRVPRPDLIYCNDLDTLVGGVVLKVLFKCKLIYDAHEFWAHADPASPALEVQSFLFFERKLLAHVDAAFTVNPLLAEQMQAALGHPFGALPNCEPLAAGSGICSTKLSAAGLSGHKAPEPWGRERVRFLFQGGFAPQRGIEELLRAWRRIADDRAVLLLRGPDNADKTRCMHLADELHLLDRTVFFLEPLFEHELIAGAAEADIGIIPYLPATINYRYCCPNKLSQYMQAGLAILANNLDFVRFIVERYQCGLVYDARDENSLVAAIQRLIEDDRFRGACQKQARKMAVQEYHWEAVSRPLYQTCAALLGLPENGQEWAPRHVRVA